MRHWRVLRSKEILNNEWLRVREDECVTARGSHIPGYYVLEKPDFTMAVPITVEGKLLLVRQYKHPVGSVILECPAGYLEEGEDPVVGVAREVREETGYRVGNVQHLGTFFTSPGVLKNRAHFYLCMDAIREGEMQLDPTEDIELVEIDFEEAVRSVRAGDLVADAASAAAILLAAGSISATL